MRRCLDFEHQAALLLVALPVSGPYIGRQLGIEIGNGHRQQLFSRVPALAASRLVDVEDACLRVDPEDAVGRLLADELGHEHLFFDLLALGDIPEKADDQFPAFKFDQRGINLDRKNRAVLAHVPRLEGETAALPQPLPVKRPTFDPGAVIDVDHGQPEQLVLAVAIFAASRCIAIDDARVLVDPEDAFRRMVAGETVDPALGLDLLAFGDVEKKPDAPQIPAIATAQCRGAALQRPAVAQIELAMIVQMGVVVQLPHPRQECVAFCHEFNDHRQQRGIRLADCRAGMPEFVRNFPDVEEAPVMGDDQPLVVDDQDPFGRGFIDCIAQQVLQFDLFHADPKSLVTKIQVAEL